MNKSDVCVVIPAYNESENIVRVANGVRDLGFPVLVVDDGSTDNSLSKIKIAGISFIRLPLNQGKGAAIRKGFEWCLNQKYQALIIMDADGQHEPMELGNFLGALQNDGVDFVIGNRMAHPVGMSWIRRLTNRFMSLVISTIAKQPIPDSQCGFRAIKRKVLEKITLRTERFEIESEILLETVRLGATIQSIPIRSVYAGRKSHIRPVRDTLRFFKFLLSYLVSRPKKS